MNNIENKYIDAYIKKVRSLLNSNRFTDNFDFPFTLSVGVARFAEEDTEADILLNHAEIALHNVKLSGKNSMSYFKLEDKADYISHLEFENQLNKAVEMNLKGFEVYYQPLVSTTDEECVGAEALLRWNSPKGDVISPALLIPVLERLKLMPIVGEFVLSRAVHQCAEWITSGTAPESFFMNVNLSPTQLRDDGLEDYILQCLELEKLAPENLTLEITENILIMDIQGGINFLQKLRKHGIRVALDDFGTGYSSLAYLRDLPVDEVKIDKLFTSEIDVDMGRLSFMKSIIQLSQSFGHFVCVEGVESREQAERLLRLKPDILQGYYYSRPMTAREFTKKFMTKALEAMRK